MEKERIGIITLYYNNNNYGGLAQAYALYKYLCNQGYEVKLISFAKKPSKQSISERLKKRLNFKNGIKGFVKGIVWLIKWIVNDLVIKKIGKIRLQKFQAKIDIRNNRFAEFRNWIPHTAVYTFSTINEVAEQFDVFISGSDQIWKPSVVQEPFVLSFVPNDKKKISYASSITTSNIGQDKKYCEFMQKHLTGYQAISVREKEAQQELTDILKREVHHVVDPTLLLEREEWENIAAERIVNEKYIFAYFLGNSSEQKKYVEKIAKKCGLAIVNLPFVSGEYNSYDWKFGDFQLYDVGIPEFFSLIKYAEVIFTDSFHAVCFCWIFKRAFYVFDRHVGFDGTKMSSRIDSILQLMQLENRKIDITSQIDFDEKILFESNILKNKIDYSKLFLNKSLSFDEVRNVNSVL